MGRRLVPIKGRWRSRRADAYIFAAAFCLFTGCQCEHGLAPLSPALGPTVPENIPVILVGQVLQNPYAAAAPEKSEWDGRPVQLWSVRVRVEQVLQGDVQSKEAEIFYFIDMGMIDTSVARVWRDPFPGHSEIFFAERDRGKLRTICDGWRSCIIWVRTGSHYNFQPEHGLPIEDVMTNILLSRGDHTTDSQMIDAIYHPKLEWGTLPVFNAFRELAEHDPSPAVRAVAADQVQNFTRYFGPVRGSPYYIR